MSKPESVGLSSDRLARIDRFLDERYIRPGNLPCAQVKVWRGGKLAHSTLLGSADIERGKPLSEDSLFRIYSMTKPVTSVAFMMLVEQGLVALDDPVARFIPEWAGLGVFDGGVLESFRTRPCARPMQIVDLLRHTSGLTYGFQQQTNVDAAYRKLKISEFAGAGALDSMIATLATLPLEFSPGEAWNYSVSTDVLGYLVGKISGKPFEVYLQDEIFGPLGMVDTGFHVAKGQESRLTACYAVGELGSKKTVPKPSLQDDPAKSPYLRKPDLTSGGGGLVSTAADYLRFCRMLLNGGELDGVRLLGPKTLHLMTANHLPGGQDMATMSRSLFSEANYAGVGFGLGFAVTLDPALPLIPGSVGDFFWGGAASTFFWVDPVEDLTVVFLTQLLPSSAYPVRRELRTLVYSAITESFA